MMRVTGGQRGSVRLEGRVWRLYFRASLAPGAPRRRKSVRLGDVRQLATRVAARRAADRLIEELDPRAFSAAVVLPWPNWCDRYLDGSLPLLARGSQSTRRSIIVKHLRPAFAEHAVHEIGSHQIQEWILSQHSAGVAASTIRARFAVLRAVLRAAAAAGLPVDPPRAGSVSFPKQERVTESVTDKAFTAVEVAAILEAAEDPWRTIYAIARFAGLRAAEVLGLQWRHVDLKKGQISIRQQVLDGDVRVLKSQGSAAVLAMPEVLRARLTAYRETWQPNAGGFLFADSAGRVLDAGALRRHQLYPLLERLKIRRRGLHAFRHAFGVAMANAGCSPEAIRRSMRHASIATTGAYLDKSAADVAEAIERGSQA